MTPQQEIDLAFGWDALERIMTNIDNATIVGVSYELPELAKAAFVQWWTETGQRPNEDLTDQEALTFGLLVLGKIHMAMAGGLELSSLPEELREPFYQWVAESQRLKEAERMNLN